MRKSFLSALVLGASLFAMDSNAVLTKGDPVSMPLVQITRHATMNQLAVDTMRLGFSTIKERVDALEDKLSSASATSATPGTAEQKQAVAIVGASDALHNDLLDAMSTRIDRSLIQTAGKSVLAPGGHDVILNLLSQAIDQAGGLFDMMDQLAPNALGSTIVPGSASMAADMVAAITNHFGGTAPTTLPLRFYTTYLNSLPNGGQVWNDAGGAIGTAVLPVYAGPVPTTVGERMDAISMALSGQDFATRSGGSTKSMIEILEEELQAFTDAAALFTDSSRAIGTIATNGSRTRLSETVQAISATLGGVTAIIKS